MRGTKLLPHTEHIEGAFAVGRAVAVTAGGGAFGGGAAVGPAAVAGVWAAGSALGLTGVVIGAGS